MVSPDGISAAEREHALEVLGRGASQVQLSTEVFALRTSAIKAATEHRQVHEALHDLPVERPRDRWFVTALRRLVGKGAPVLFLPGPDRRPLSIGRAPGSMLRLTHYTVSRMHAQLYTRADGWCLRDLGSSNGTWVNGGRVTSPMYVRPGDVVRFGEVGFRLEVPDTAAGRPAKRTHSGHSAHSARSAHPATRVDAAQHAS